MILRAALLGAALWVAGPAAAVDLILPQGARPLSVRESPLDSYDMPVAAFDGDALPTVTREGRVLRRSWRVGNPALTTLQVLEPIRTALAAEGYEVVFSCVDTACGGYDFRFETEVIPAPDMHVDIRDFRFLSAANPQTGAAITVLVSRSRSAIYVQAVEVFPSGGGAIAMAPAEGPDMTTRLLEEGHAVLADLEFGSGAEALNEEGYDNLEALARLLADRPDLQLLLVGHTDSVGDLDANIALSRDRAAAVRDRLIAAYGVDPDRLRAEGMGYLAPVASNLTPEGRRANRRVEAVVLPAP